MQLEVKKKTLKNLTNLAEDEIEKKSHRIEKYAKFVIKCLILQT